MTHTPRRIEKPILFSAPMVLALLNAKPNVWPAEPIDASKPWKTQTRRIVKLPRWAEPSSEIELYDHVSDSPAIGTRVERPHAIAKASGCLAAIDPAYEVGDILWVRETWMENTPPCGYIYRATDEETLSHRAEGRKWRPSIFMPRRASRLTLEVKRVRCERVQCISEEDALAEGCEAFPITATETELIEDPFMRNLSKAFEGGELTAKFAYMQLWDEINGKNSWARNPFVFVYDIARTRIDAGRDS